MCSSDLSYGAAVATAAALSSEAIVVNSFSKYFSMTGWRLGWLLLPEDLLEPVERLAQNLVICPTTLAQHAALRAFDATAELDGHVARYRENRAVLLEGLPAAGLSEFAPADGAFYVYADVSGLGVGSTELCRRWLAELDVATTPGIDFDPVRGENTVRFSFAGATADIIEAVSRLARWSP